ncbi:MAG TPA: MauE/DoxX family redox-associated membrane protein, partial [Pedococcus sp.]|nr:MauE/DoxX family redox-associated membrane protein [Pedococcus sp.]
MKTPAPLTKDLIGLATLFLTSGTTHLVRPEVFDPLVPSSLPRRRELIYASGVAELICAAGLLHPRTRRHAGWASAALLLGVFP